LTWEYLRVQSSCEVTPPNVWPERLMARVLLQSRYFVRGLRLAARRPRTWLNALALGLVPCGLLAFMCYGQWYIGDFFATFHASKWGWGRQLSSPLRLLVYSVRHPIWGQPLNWNFWTLNMVATCAFLAVLVWAFRRLPLIYALYTAVTVLLPLSSDSLNSIARYDLLVFPAFILLALYTCWQEKRASMRQQTLHHFIIGAFASLQAVLLVLFVLGAFAIA
jgi:hypothetical protein